MTDQEKQDIIIKQLGIVYQRVDFTKDEYDLLEPFNFIAFLKHIVNKLETDPENKTYEVGSVPFLNTEYAIGHLDVLRLVREYIVFKEIIK